MKQNEGSTNQIDLICLCIAFIFRCWKNVSHTILAHRAVAAAAAYRKKSSIEEEEDERRRKKHTIPTHFSPWCFCWAIVFSCAIRFSVWNVLLFARLLLLLRNENAACPILPKWDFILPSPPPSPLLIQYRWYARKTHTHTTNIVQFVQPSALIESTKVHGFAFRFFDRNIFLLILVQRYSIAIISMSISNHQEFLLHF